MKLIGWDYTGRNISYELHLQIYKLVNTLSDKDFVGNLTWGTELQTKLLKPVGITSSGILRTVKKICDNFGFFDIHYINGNTIPDGTKILTSLGKKLYHVIDLEKKIKESVDLSPQDFDKAIEQIKILYEEIYCEGLLQYKIKNLDGTSFSPLKITLLALQKYQTLDKWEWYLLNTLVRHENNEEEEKQFNIYLNQYRQKKISFTMNDVVEKPKGHQYLPQYFNFAGLAIVEQKPHWFIKNSLKHSEIKQIILK